MEFLREDLYQISETVKVINVNDLLREICIAVFSYS